jgi:glycosyltransferase involved in cell wall biosynthesis
MPLISIITPSYNDGAFLNDAFESICLNKFNDIFEYIIVNDGNTDEFTLQKIAELETKGAIIVHQSNKGLAGARNAGINISNGKYILPLDSDNKIEPEVFIEAAGIMENNDKIDMVYTDASFFGEKAGIWEVGHFNGLKLLFDNYIDACALIRKSSFLDVGMYDTNIPIIGHDDWELLVNFFLQNKGIYYLPKIGFHYRVRKNSMLSSTTGPNFGINKKYIYSKHNHNISQKILDLDKKIKYLQQQMKRRDTYLKENKLKSMIKIFLGKKIL